MGGEPLLHPDILSILEVFVAFAPETSRLKMVTNGTLLSRQEQEFFEFAAENNVTLSVSQYPSGKVLEESMKRKLSRSGARCEVWRQDRFISFLNQYGDSCVSESFGCCSLKHYYTRESVMTVVSVKF